VLNTVLHHINDTHVAHHLFFNMPHYHAQEATEAIKPILGDYYRFHNTTALGILPTLWRCYSRCQIVAPDSDTRLALSPAAPASGKSNNQVYWFHSVFDRVTTKNKSA